MTDTAGTCAYCARVKRLTQAGKVRVHYLTLTVYGALPDAARQVRRRCPGSGKVPKAGGPVS